MIARGACFGSAAGEDDLRVLAQWLRDCAALEDVGDDPTKPSRGSLADMTEPLPVKMPEKVPVKVPGSFPASVERSYTPAHGWPRQNGADK
jgi:hypothetical protein